MPMISENWSRLLEPGQRKVFVDVFQEQPSNIHILFDVQSSSKAQEFDLQDGPIQDFAPMNGNIPYDDAVQGYRTTYTHSSYARGFKVQRELVDDDMYNVINKKPAKLAMGARRRREADAASVFNNAFNSSVTGGDALSLCNSAHTSLNGGANQSNTGTLSLNPVNVEATRRLMVAFRDPVGGIIHIQPDFLLVPTQLAETAWEIISSKGKVDTAQNNANYHYGKYKLLVWDNYLTDSNNWFMIDSQMMKQFLLWFDRVSPEFFRDKDFDTLQAKFAGYMRYSFGWSDWPWVLGQNPS